MQHQLFITRIHETLVPTGDIYARMLRSITTCVCTWEMYLHSGSGLESTRIQARTELDVTLRRLLAEQFWDGACEHGVLLVLLWKRDVAVCLIVV